jgi:hypothetical protein
MPPVTDTHPHTDVAVVASSSPAARVSYTLSSSLSDRVSFSSAHGTGVSLIFHIIHVIHVVVFAWHRALGGGGC